jgi:hypothetical protein
MRVSTTYLMAVMAVCFSFLLVPRAALAQTSSNCPVEPTSTPIAIGEVYAGGNCNLFNDGDVDGFTFNGTSGDTYQLATALSDGAVTNICLTLYGPTFKVVYGPTCTNAFAYTNATYSVVTDQKLTATGTYTIDIQEQSPGSTTPQNYGVSLEQVYPFPSYATQVPKLGESLAGDITPLTDANLFTFTSATTGEYEVTATLTSNPTQNICLTVYDPDGTTPGSGCTNAFAYTNATYSFSVDFTPDETNPSMAFVAVDGNGGTQTYNLEVSCLVGYCPPPIRTYPPCTLKDSLAYNASTSTLTMNFTVGNKYAATWNAWLTYQSTLVPIPGFPMSQPITNPPVPVTETYTGLGAEGTVGVLSTLTTSTGGITCSSWEQVNTGKP